MTTVKPDRPLRNSPRTAPSQRTDGRIEKKRETYKNTRVNEREAIKKSKKKKPPKKMFSKANALGRLEPVGT